MDRYGDNETMQEECKTHRGDWVTDQWLVAWRQRAPARMTAARTAEDEGKLLEEKEQCEGDNATGLLRRLEKKQEEGN